MKNVSTPPNLEALMRMLETDRVDLVVVNLSSGQRMLKKLNLESIIHPLFPPITQINLYHYLNVRHHDLAIKVNAMLSAMARSGELAMLRKKFYAELPQN